MRSEATRSPMPRCPNSRGSGLEKRSQNRGPAHTGSQRLATPGVRGEHLGCEAAEEIESFLVGVIVLIIYPALMRKLHTTHRSPRPRPPPVHPLQQRASELGSGQCPHASIW